MPASSCRRRLTQRRRSSSSAATAVPGSVSTDSVAAGSNDSGIAIDCGEEEAPEKGGWSLASIVAALWLPSYVELFAAELEHNRRIVGRYGSALEPSSYRARLKGARAEAYDAKMLRRERDHLAIELHANNMRSWSPSLVARSIAYYHLTSVWQLSVETGQRRLASQPLAPPAPHGAAEDEGEAAVTQALQNVELVMREEEQASAAAAVHRRCKPSPSPSTPPPSAPPNPTPALPPKGWTP